VNPSNHIPNDTDRMMAIAVGVTLAENIDLHLYYTPAARGFRTHRYVALYSNKSIRAIGELENIVCANRVAGKLLIAQSESPVTRDQEGRIVEAIVLAPGHDYDIHANHRFFLVKEFVATNFQKTSFGGLRAKRYFSVRAELGLSTSAKLPDIHTVANALKARTWG
jgi:hypothetical protein